MTYSQSRARLFCVLSMVFCLCSSAVFVRGDSTASHQSLHDVYLANTEHELHVYRIYGKKPGKTIMLIGGIQGDEPGGYLTVDLYADINLQQGNLIVVPRANFYSILLNRRNGLTGDMNRKFAEKEDSAKTAEQHIVSILKKLIDEADCLLNLHEGSGFFNSQWVSDQENPDRFGQSIIFDAKTYVVPDTQRIISLEKLALRVIDRVNPELENARYHFKPNNHNTVSDTSSHLEQRKSATYYALTQANIPAFGVETSKSIRSISQKVSLQKMVVNAFMEEFGIIPDTPGQHHEKAELNYVLISINGALPYAVPNGAELRIERGDEVTVTDIIANLDRGLAADFLAMGSYNDTNLPFRISQPTKIIIRKDAETCGWVDIVIKPNTAESRIMAVADPIRPKGAPASTIPRQEIAESHLLAEKLFLNVDGRLVSIDEGKELVVPKDKPLVLKGVQTNISRLDHQILANLRGFAPPKSSNDGNDFNYPVYPDQDLWIRYSEDKAGIRYPVDTMYNDKEIGRFWIRLE